MFDRIEERILSIIDEHSEEIIRFGRDIWDHAEMGFKEYRTAQKFADKLREYGIEPETGLAITGVKGYLKEPECSDITVALMGEMDALPMPTHFAAWSETGAAHTCGHNAQLTGVVGAMIALTDPEVSNTLGGNLVFFGVPAEEYVDIEYKNGLIREGKLGFGGGKSELIRLGDFDDVDIAISHHIVGSKDAPGVDIALSNTTFNGFVNKTVHFKGVSTHAAMRPELGVDALSAAELAMHAVSLQRESFRDEDAVRVHGFISRAGEAMNLVADHTTMEYSVRAKNMEAVLDASRKFDRAMRAGAIAMGCGMELITVPGFLPVVPAKDPSLVTGVLRDLAGDEYSLAEFGSDMHKPASTDCGDLSQMIPLFTFNTGGYYGSLHGMEVKVDDEYLSYVITAKAFALIAYRMLKDGAVEAKRIKSEYKPALTKEEYVQLMNELNHTEVIEMEKSK